MHGDVPSSSPCGLPGRLPSEQGREGEYRLLPWYKRHYRTRSNPTIEPSLPTALPIHELQVDPIGRHVHLLGTCQNYTGGSVGQSSEGAFAAPLLPLPSPEASGTILPVTECYKGMRSCFVHSKLTSLSRVSRMFHRSHRAGSSLSAKQHQHPPCRHTLYKAISHWALGDQQTPSCIRGNECTEDKFHIKSTLWPAFAESFLTIPAIVTLCGAFLALPEVPNPSHPSRRASRN